MKLVPYSGYEPVSRDFASVVEAYVARLPGEPEPVITLDERETSLTGALLALSGSDDNVYPATLYLLYRLGADDPDTGPRPLTVGACSRWLLSQMWDCVTA